jgi:hypothetical protein
MLKRVERRHSRFIPKRVAEASQIFLGDAHVLPKYLAMSNTAQVTSGKPIAVWSQSILGVNAINTLGATFTISMEERERCYSFILSRTPHGPFLNRYTNNFNLAQLLAHVCTKSPRFVANMLIELQLWPLNCKKDRDECNFDNKINIINMTESFGYPKCIFVPAER